MSSLARFVGFGQRVLCRKHATSVQPVRRMGGGPWSYREEQMLGLGTPKWHWNYATLIGFLTIFWSGYMTYNHFGHIVGEFPNINPSEWTDEELGIPPDEEDIYPEGYIPLAQRT